MSATSVTPALSVVLATPDTYETMRATVSHLRAQSIVDQLELVVVAPSRARLAFPADVEAAFGRLEVVELGDVLSVGSANAAGIRRASAPIVAIAETHSFPQSDWAEALVAAHRGPWAGVGPSVLNANPIDAVSWASFLVAYGHWSLITAAGPVDDVPGHNSCYKRTALLPYDADLERLMETETLLHWALRAEGHKLYFEPRAKTFHVNPTRLSSCLIEVFHYQRVFGASRSSSWPWARRAAYSAGAPLIVALRFRRLVKQLSAIRTEGIGRAAILSVAFVVLASATLGETVGSLAGAGDAAMTKADTEFHRQRHLKKSDHSWPAN